MSCLFIFIFVFSSMYRRYHYKDFLRMDLNASSLVSEVTANCPTKMACSQPLFRLLSVFVLSNINKIYTQQKNVKTDPSSMRHWDSNSRPCGPLTKTSIGCPTNLLQFHFQLQIVFNRFDKHVRWTGQGIGAFNFNLASSSCKQKSVKERPYNFFL